MSYFVIQLFNPKVIMGIFIGSILTFVFLPIDNYCRWSLTTGKMVAEVRRQFREIAGIMTGDAKLDYG